MLISYSDTTSNTLACVLYYLARHPHIQSKLHSLIAAATPGGYSAWTYEAVKSVTYVDDIINESLRLKPPVVNIPSRVTPSSGIQIASTHIPGNVHVSVPTILMQRDPRVWVEPDVFVPERWGERLEKMGTDAGCFMPFNIGMHACPGVNLAFLSLRTSISSLVMNFKIGFGEGEDGRRFDEEWEDTVLITLEPLFLRFRKRV
jgi:cytochrome P450